MNKEFKVIIPIFNQSLKVIFGDMLYTKEVLKKQYKMSEDDAKTFEERIKGANGMTLKYEGYNTYYLWLSSVPKSTRGYAVLVHELQHFVFMLLQDLGFEHSDASDELYSYLIEYMFESISKEIN